MPMTDEQRRAYLQRAGVAQEQIDETVGELPIHEPTLQEREVARDDAERARGAIRQVLADAAITRRNTAPSRRPTGRRPRSTRTNSRPTAQSWTSCSQTSTHCSTPAATC